MASKGCSDNLGVWLNRFEYVRVRCKSFCKGIKKRLAHKVSPGPKKTLCSMGRPELVLM